MTTIVQNQAGWFTDWYVWQQPLGFLIFFIAATAEANRTLRPDRGGLRDRRRLRDRVLGDALRVLLLRRRERLHHLALTVTLFFGGWNAPIAWPAEWAINLSINPGSLRIALLLIVLIAARPDARVRDAAVAHQLPQRPGRRCSAASCSPTCS